MTARSLHEILRHKGRQGSVWRNRVRRDSYPKEQCEALFCHPVNTRQRAPRSWRA